MCLVLFSIKAHPDYPLVIAANRDEFYARPTEPAGFWEENRQILAGRDLLGGGTWMGVSRKGKVALLTNYRDPSEFKENAPSRGALVRNFLENDTPAEEYVARVVDEGEQYNGFNLICGSLQGDLWYYGNYGGKARRIGTGIFGLSNALLNTSWPKVQRGRDKLEDVLKKSRIRERDLFELLYDDLKAPEDKLPDTGIGREMEQLLSPIFIKSPEYGSRCSTVLLVDRQGNVTFSERTYDVITFEAVTRTFMFGL